MKRPLALIAWCLCGSILPASGSPQEWPVLRHYDQDHLVSIALPLGGIGTGTVSLGGRGELRDWQIMNRPAIGFSTVVKGNNAPFFAIYVKPAGGSAQTKALIGPVHPSEYLHAEGRPANNHGMPRFAHASFDAAYPFGQVRLSDDILPVNVTIQGFNPFIPGNSDDSSIPIAVLRYVVANPTDRTMEVAVCGTMRNFIGMDGSKIARDWKGDPVPIGASKNRNAYRDGGGVRGIFMSTDDVDREDAAWGTMALTTPEAENVTYRRSSTPNDWENATLDLWDDLSEDGLLSDKQALADDNPMASLAVKRLIPPRTTSTFTFYLTWHFPNRRNWNESEVIGNYYTSRYADAWDVILREEPRLARLEEETIRFVRAFLSTTVPDVVKEAALFNLSTLRTQTVFRIPSGHLLGWEGMMDGVGSCSGSCTHVWNYETATSFLFGDLARTMRDVEFTYGTTRAGHMRNRVELPLEDNCGTTHVAAADGQMGTIMRFYRDWKLSGDMAFLEHHWPRVRAAMAYAWTPGGWDANADGVEEGEQHNTMDVNYYGPNPQMQFWYFGALRASARMARAMHDTAFAARCDEVFRNGSTWVDQHLFNGDYYEHRITDPKTRDFLNMSDTSVVIPPYQLGSGCLVDQLVGQYMSHVCGLGYLADREHVRTALRTIMQHNFVEGFGNRFNNMRSYVMGDESGLIMASWPKGRLKVPFPYFAESMTGFEYAAAIGMLYEGQTDAGLRCIRAIRARFDGARRNPFDEPECGHHYARAMAAWSAPLAISGFQYDGPDRSISFTSTPGTWFWSNGSAWGTCTTRERTATLRILHGSLNVSSITLVGSGSAEIPGGALSAAGTSEVTVTVR